MDLNDVSYVAKPNSQKFRKQQNLNSRDNINLAPLPAHSVSQTRSGPVFFPGLLPQPQGNLAGWWAVTSAAYCYHLKLWVAATGMHQLQEYF